MTIYSYTDMKKLLTILCAGSMLFLFSCQDASEDVFQDQLNTSDEMMDFDSETNTSNEMMDFDSETN